MDLTDLFKKFEFNRLPKDFLNKVWLDGFSEVVDLPPEYKSFLEGINIDNLICCTIECVKNWLVSSLDKETSSKENGEKSGEQFSWKNLARNVDLKALLCLLSAFIHKKKTDCITEKLRLRTIKSAHLYFLLLAIPGSKFFHIYNDNLYSYALGILQLCNLINIESQKTEAKGKGEKKHERQSSGSSIDENALLNAIISLMDDLILVLKNFGFRNLTNCLETTVTTLLQITRLEKKNTSIVLKSPKQDSVSCLAHKAYFALTLLCSLEHGDVEDTVKLITGEMLKYLNASNEKDTKMTPGERATIRNNSISFLHHLVTSVGEPSYNGIVVLVKRLCLETPDKAEIRAKNVQTILDIIELMPAVLYAKIVFFIICLVHNDKIKNRVTALDILARLVLWNERIKPNDKNFMEEIFLNHKYLLSAIYGRCKDISATVKAKAITVFGSCISSNNSNVKDLIGKIFVTCLRPSQNVSELMTDSFFNMHQFLQTKSYNKGDVNPLPDAEAIIDTLTDSISHEKVLIRKAAYQALTDIFIVNKKWMTDEILKVMVKGCRDMSVLIRKTLINCLTDLLLHYSSSEEVAFYWVQGVMPLIGDQEVKSQEKIVKAVKTLILDSLVKNEEKRGKSVHHLPWKLIEFIKDNMQKEFLIVCSKWIEYKLFDSALFDVIKSHIYTERNNYAWFLLCSLSGFTQIENSQYILDYFSLNVDDENGVDEDCCQMVTEVLYYNWRTLSLEDQIALKDRLLISLSKFTVPLPLIGRYIDMCNLITRRLESSPNAARKNISIWASNLITTAEKQIFRRIGPGSPRVIDKEQLLCQLISTLGYATHICPNVMKYETVVILKNILEVYQENKEPGTSRWKGESSPAVQAVTLVTIGKFCIQNKKFAESTIPLLAQVLNKTIYDTVKINAMIALLDLFKRHTSLVENYIRDNIYVCLKDDSIEIRFKALILLINLIQQDFFRFCSPLFFHLLTMIHDEGAVIRETVESFIFKIAIIKNKSILAQQFIESVFHYNEYNDTRFIKTVMTEKEHQLFSITGKHRAEKRQDIYNFMLTKMLDEDRFRILYQLCDILEKVVEGAISLNDSGKAVVQDVFNIISSDSIQLKILSYSPSDEVEGKTDGELKPMDLKSYAQKNILSQDVRHNVIENIMPVFISLKNKLISIRSPLIDDLRRCVLQMMKHYKDEVKVILKDDPEFAEEIAFDLWFATEKEEEDNSEETQTRKIAEEFLKKSVVEPGVICEKLKETELQEIMASILSRSLDEAEDDPTNADRGVDIERKKAAITPEALAAVYPPRTVQRTSKFTPNAQPSETSCDIFKSREMSFLPEAVSPQSQNSRYSPVPGTSKSEESNFQLTLSPKGEPSQSKTSPSAIVGPGEAAFGDDDEEEKEPEPSDVTSQSQGDKCKKKRIKRNKTLSMKKHKK